MSLSWVESLTTQFSKIILRSGENSPGDQQFFVTREGAFEFLETLKNLEGGAFDHLADLTAYDVHPKSPRFHVVYELVSMLRKKRCSVVVPLPDEDPSLRSVYPLWKGSNWLEREVFDMFGIVFHEHPDMRRILLPASFKGHPLQKDFVVDYRQTFVKDAKGEGVFDPFNSTILETGDY